MKWFYEKNTDFLQHSVNKTFEEILDMTTAEFQQWCIELRKVVVDLWDNKNQPPRVGYTEAEMAEQFNDMIGYPVHEFLVEDQLTGEKNVIRNNSNIGNAANQFFPTMMKTRINYSKGDNGKSIYDHFAREDLLDKFLLYASRHFKRDSFYNYSVSVHVNSLLKIGTLNKKFSSGVEFIEWFESVGRKIGTHDYWLSPSKEASVYTGFNDDLRGKVSLFVTRKDIERLNIPARSLSNVDWEESEYYLIRIFSYGQRLFPIGLKAFRVSFCQYAVNFPPLTARFLYERYTQHIRSQDLIRIYDPSAGWGGRILGAADRNTKDLIESSIEAMGPQYPELEVDKERIIKIAQAEEEAFLSTLKSGTLIFDQARSSLSATGTTVISGEDAFKLHDTYGFPFDLTLEMAAEHGLSIDAAGFKRLMSGQRERAKADAKAKKTGHTDLSEYRKIAESAKRLEFVGYENFVAEASLVGILVNGKSEKSASAGDEVEIILDRTPFYAEGGG